MQHLFFTIPPKNIRLYLLPCSFDTSAVCQPGAACLHLLRRSALHIAFMQINLAFARQIQYTYAEN